MEDINMGALTTAKFSIRRGGTSNKRSDVMSAMCESDATIEVNLETASTLTGGRNSNSSSCLETRTASTSGGSYERSDTATSSSIGEIRTASASPCPEPDQCPIIAQRQKPNSSLADILAASVSRSPSHRSRTPPKPCVRIAVPEATPHHPNIIRTHTLHLDGSDSTPIPQPVGKQQTISGGNLFNGLGVFDYDSSEETIDSSSREASRSASVKTEATIATGGGGGGGGGGVIRTGVVPSCEYSDAGSPPPPRRSVSSGRSRRSSSRAASSVSAKIVENTQRVAATSSVSSRKPTRSCSAGTSRSTATTRRKMYFGAAERQWQIAREREWIDTKKIRPKGIIPDARNETVAQRVYGKAAEEEENELLEQFHNQHHENDLDVDELVSRLHPSKAVLERKQKELQELYCTEQQQPHPVRHGKVDLNRLAQQPKREVCNYNGFDKSKENTFKPKITKHFVTESANYGKYMGPVWQRLTKPKKTPQQQ